MHSLLSASRHGMLMALFCLVLSQEEASSPQAGQVVEDGEVAVLEIMTGHSQITLITSNALFIIPARRLLWLQNCLNLDSTKWHVLVLNDSRVLADTLAIRWVRVNQVYNERTRICEIILCTNTPVYCPSDPCLFPTSSHFHITRTDLYFCDDQGMHITCVGSAFNPCSSEGCDIGGVCATLNAVSPPSGRILTSAPASMECKKHGLMQSPLLRAMIHVGPMFWRNSPS